MAQDLIVKLVTDRTELRSLSVPPVVGLEAILAQTGRRYRYDSTSTAQDIGDEKVVRPNSIPVGSPGRWVSTEPLRIIDRILVRALADQHIDHLFQTDPSLPGNPPANTVRTWVGKTGAGRLQLRARFPNGSQVNIATSAP